jgi:hypothetical protein
MKNCPDTIELSSWHDGEGELDLEGHVKECSKCRETVEFYTKIDRALKNAPPPDAMLKTKILSACACEKASEPLFSFVPLLRVAAALVIIVAVGYSILIDMGNNPGREGVVAKSDGGISISVDGENLERAEAEQLEGDILRPSLGDQNEYTVLVKRGNEIRALYGPRQMPFSSLQPLSRNDIGDSRLVSAAMAPMASNPVYGDNHGTPSILPRQVRHVWVVDSLEKGKNEFLEQLPDGALCSICDPDMGKEAAPSSVCFSVELGEEQLQGLVDQLSASGWALVSSALPQPGEPSRLLLTGESVSYIVELVAAE